MQIRFKSFEIDTDNHLEDRTTLRDLGKDCRSHG